MHPCPCEHHISPGQGQQLSTWPLLPLVHPMVCSPHSSQRAFLNTHITFYSFPAQKLLISLWINFQVFTLAAHTQPHMTWSLAVADFPHPISHLFFHLSLFFPARICFMWPSLASSVSRPHQAHSCFTAWSIPAPDPATLCHVSLCTPSWHLLSYFLSWVTKYEQSHLCNKHYINYCKPAFVLSVLAMLTHLSLMMTFIHFP